MAYQRGHGRSARVPRVRAGRSQAPWCMKWSPWLAPAIAVGAALRLLSPTRLALWRDEAQYVGIASMADPGSILAFLYHHESHPPLFYLLGHFLGAVGGGVEQAIGALSLAASITAIVATYWLATNAFSALAGVVAAMATALSVPLVLHSVQDRPYALLALLFLASTAGLWRYLATGSRPSLGLWLASSVVALYTHHSTVLLLTAQGVYLTVCALRGSTEAPWRWREILGATAALVLLWIPGALLLVHQSRVTGYPALHPIQWDGPPRLFLRMMLEYPLEILLPTVLGAVAIAHFLRAPFGQLSRLIPTAGLARGLLFAVAPGFLIFAMLGNYRSALLTPHVVLAVAPLGMVTVGGLVAELIERGRRWRAALLLESAIACATLGASFQAGFSETMAPEVAGIIDAEGMAGDLLVLSPGVMGTSFNRARTDSFSQIDFPFEGGVAVYPFDRDFERLADPVRWELALDSIHTAFRSGRRVWLISDARWIHPFVAAPARLSPDSLRGMGQADRARANGFYRYLRWLYGPPRAEYGTSAQGRGPELMAAWLFAPSLQRDGKPW